MAAKMLGELNLGMQHQSMEPSYPTKAAVLVFPMIPYPEIGL
jgi:hypothetical protein